MHALVQLAQLFNPGDPIWNFLTLVITAIGGIIGSIIALWKPLQEWLIRERQGKLLSYQVISDIGLINAQKDLGEDIKLTLDGHQVNDARLIMVQLENTGTEIVTFEDLEKHEPIRFEFDPPTLLRCAVHSTEPENLIPQDRLKSMIKLDTDPRQGDDSSLATPAPPTTHPTNTLVNKLTTTLLNLGTSPQPVVSNKPPAVSVAPAHLHAYAELLDFSLNKKESLKLKFVTRGRTEMHVVGHVNNGKIRPYTQDQPLSRSRNTFLIILAVVLILVLLINGINFVASSARNHCTLWPPFSTIHVSSSTAFVSTAKVEADSYQNTCFTESVVVNSGPSGSSLRDLAQGNVDIASSELTPDDPNYSFTGLVEHKVAAIVFCMVVNKSVTHVASLTQSQLTAIYSGGITNWRQVDGPDLPIITIGRSSDSGTYATFKRFVLNSQGGDAQIAESTTQEVIDKVSSTPGAIGYVDLGTANRASLTVTELEINNYSPTVGLVESNLYPFWAIERMYTRTEASSLALSFIDHVTSDIQTNDTFIRLNDIPGQTLKNHS